MDQQPTINISPEYLEQNPIVAIALMAFPLFFMAFVVGALTSWTFLIIRAVQGKPLLTPEPWKPRVWGFVDILVAVLFIIFWQFQSALIGYNVLGLGRQELPAAHSLSLPLATLSGLGNVAAMLTLCLWIIVRHRASLTQLGFGFVRWWKHIAIGVIAALASIPLVYALMAAVSVGFDNTYAHPLIEEMKRNGSLPAYLLAVTSAVLIAPLVEEFLFRVLIQGWLQSVPFGSIKSIVLGHRETTQLAFATISADVNLTPSQDNPYAPLSVTLNHFAATDANTEPSSLTPPIWPSFVTGTLFGLAHFSYGFSFIPLIVLGVILGLLYRATHSIWPSLVVHLILNGSSMLALGLSILIGRATN